MTNKTNDIPAHMLLHQEVIDKLPINFRFPMIDEPDVVSPYRRERFWPSKFYQNDFSACRFPLKPISKLLDRRNESI